MEIKKYRQSKICNHVAIMQHLCYADGRHKPILRNTNMPQMPMKQCSFSGCSNLTRSSRCHDHEKIYAKIADDRRETATARGYDHRWRQIAARKLASDPLCERCHNAGKIVAAAIVHHRDHNSRNNNSGNHESLCVACHEVEHRATRWGRGG